MELRVGAKVVLREDSEFFYQAPDTVGLCTEKDRLEGWFRVVFSNGCSDVYRDSDVKVLGYVD